MYDYKIKYNFYCQILSKFLYKIVFFHTYCFLFKSAVKLAINNKSPTTEKVKKTQYLVKCLHLVRTFVCDKSLKWSTLQGMWLSWWASFPIVDICCITPRCRIFQIPRVNKSHVCASRVAQLRCRQTWTFCLKDSLLNKQFTVARVLKVLWCPLRINPNMP